VGRDGRGHAPRPAEVGHGHGFLRVGGGAVLDARVLVGRLLAAAWICIGIIALPASVHGR
jgi:hypothetical protein